MMGIHRNEYTLFTEIDILGLISINLYFNLLNYITNYVNIMTNFFFFYFVTVGGSPYSRPRVLNHDLLQYLEAGNRMDKPSNCDTKV